MNPSQIISDPKIMMGEPTVVGTRLTVEFILEELAATRSNNFSKAIRASSAKRSPQRCRLQRRRMDKTQ